jgi:ribonuclease-3
LCLLSFGIFAVKFELIIFFNRLHKKMELSISEMNSDQAHYCPWNSQNKDVPDSEILKILSTYGVKDVPHNYELFRQAFVHRSYVDRPEGPATRNSGEKVIIAPRPEGTMPLKLADNEELEHHGDGILQAVTAEYLCLRYPGEGEGFWTSLRSNLVNNKMLGHLAEKIGMNKWLIVSRHVEDLCNGRRNLRILGSMLEAWIGALYRDLVQVDRGKAFSRAFDWIVTLFETHVDFAQLISQNTNYKDQLLKHYQATYHQPPRYKEVAVEGPLHNRTFTMGVLAPDGSVVEVAVARNKKVAEQEASRKALVKLGVINANAPQRVEE